MNKINEIDRVFPPAPFRFNLQIHEGEKPKYEKIEDVDSAEKMKSFVDNTNLFIENQNQTIETQTKEIEEGKAERGRLAKDLDGIIQINKNKWQEPDPEKNADYQLGKWWARWMLGY